MKNKINKKKSIKEGQEMKLKKISMLSNSFLSTKRLDVYKQDVWQKDEHIHFKSLKNDSINNIKFKIKRLYVLLTISTVLSVAWLVGSGYWISIADSTSLAIAIAIYVIGFIPFCALFFIIYQIIKLFLKGKEVAHIQGSTLKNTKIKKTK